LDTEEVLEVQGEAPIPIVDYGSQQNHWEDTRDKGDLRVLNTLGKWPHLFFWLGFTIICYLWRKLLINHSNEKKMEKVFIVFLYFYFFYKFG